MDGFNIGNFSLNSGLPPSLSRSLSESLSESLLSSRSSLPLHPEPSISLHPSEPMWKVAGMRDTTPNYVPDTRPLQIPNDAFERIPFQDYNNVNGRPRYQDYNNVNGRPRYQANGITVGSRGYLSVMLTHFTFRKETFQYLSRNLVGDWKDLGRCLNVEGPTLYSLERKYDAQEAAYQTILHWAISNGSKATPNILAEGLRNVARTDLAEYVEKEEGYRMSYRS